MFAFGANILSFKLRYYLFILEKEIEEVVFFHSFVFIHVMCAMGGAAHVRISSYDFVRIISSAHVRIGFLEFCTCQNRFSRVLHMSESVF